MYVYFRYFDINYTSHKERFILSLNICMAAAAAAATACTYNHIQLSSLLFSSLPSPPDSHARHEDCEKPPEVENASASVRVDENEEFVTATYRCNDGYKLNGRAIITCDLDTDEWQEQPPTCEQRKKLFVLLGLCGID
jgi:hypothetical protein